MLLGLCLLVNIVSFALYGVDKRRAQAGSWRIRESTLLCAAWLMGGVGAWLGMRVFRHKTKHRIFTVTVPLAAVLQIALIASACIRLLGI